MFAKHIKFIVSLEEEGVRLLTFLKKKLATFTTEDLRYAIMHHRCTINGIVERFESRKVKSQDAVCIWIEKKPTFVFEEKRVIYEDEYLCVYNKPPGIPVTEEKGLAALFSLFPAHRLDRDTSGALLFVKEKKWLKVFEDLFLKREIAKEYLALVHSCPTKKNGCIEKRLKKYGHKEGIVKWKTHCEGLYAKTLWQVEKSGDKYSLLRCTPITGRTHQIRVHLASMGHPILGDVHYGAKSSSLCFRPLLHAEKLSFQHPYLKKNIQAIAEPPEDFVEVLNHL